MAASCMAPRLPRDCDSMMPAPIQRIRFSVKLKALPNPLYGLATSTFRDRSLRSL